MASESSLLVTVPTERLLNDLGEIPGVEIVLWAMDGPAPREQIDIVVPPYMTAKKLLGVLEGISTRLVQWQSIGYEALEDLLPPGTVFANASSVHETSTAELAVGLAIAGQRRMAEFIDNAREHVWKARFSPSLADRRVLLVGFGGVGKAIAQRLVGFEVDVTAVARTAREEDGIRVRPMEELDELLAGTEVVILSLPGGDETRHILDARRLALLPDDALIVNVGRGTLIDTDALVAETSSGRLRAALDVVDPEPLPEDHPLWDIPGVLLVPHVGGDTSAMRPRIAKLVRTQIDRMLAGEEPLNVVIRT
jgi:phosphoglycerate dehydrogenase-like enzyme